MTASSALVAVGIDFDDAELEASVRAGLESVETELLAAVQSEDDFVSEVAKHLVDAGGKRFRPLLTLLSAHFGEPHSEEVISSAVVCELPRVGCVRAVVVRRLRVVGVGRCCG